MPANEDYVQDMLDSMFEHLEICDFQMQVIGTVETSRVLGVPGSAKEKWSGHFNFIPPEQHIAISMQVTGLEQPDVSARMHIMSMVTALEDLAREIRMKVLL